MCYSSSINFENFERNASQEKKVWTFLLMHLGIKVCGRVAILLLLYYLVFLLFLLLLCLLSSEMLAAAQTRSYRMVYSLPMLDMLRRLPIMSHPLKIIHFFQHLFQGQALVFLTNRKMEENHKNEEQEVRWKEWKVSWEKLSPFLAFLIWLLSP